MEIVVKLRHASHVILACHVLLALGVTVFAGCDKSRVRTLPSATDKYLDVNVLSYENEEYKKIFGAHSIATERQLGQYTGNLVGHHARRFEHDPRLDAVAYVYAYSWNQDISYPAGTLIDWMMWKLGITGTRIDSNLYWAYRGSGNTSVRLDQKLHHWAQDFEDRLGDENTRYAFGLVRIKDGTMGHCQALVVVRKAAEIQELPKHYSLGDTMKISGKMLLSSKFTSFHMTLDGPDNLNMTVKVDPDGRFDFEVPVPNSSGTHFVELKTFVKPRRQVTIFKVPIYVDAPEPGRPEDIVLNPPPNPMSEKDWPRTIQGLINSKRAEYGIGPMKWNSKTAAILPAEAKKQVKDWRLRLTNTRKLLRQAGMSVVHYGQTILYGESIHESFWQAKNSPWFRGQILDDRLTQMAVGTARYDDSKYADHFSLLLFNGEPKGQVVLPEEIVATLKSGISTYDDPATREKSQSERWRTTFASDLETRLDEATKPEVRHDPALDLLALMYARDGWIEEDLRDWLQWKLGVTGDVTYTYRSIREDDRINEHMIAEIKADMEEDREDEEKKYVFGATRIPYKGGLSLETVIVVEKEVELIEPLQMIYDPGSEIVVTGRFLGDAEDPRMMIDLGDGRISSWRINADKDGYFGAKLPVPSSPGRHLLEISSRRVTVENMKLHYGSHRELVVPIYVRSEKGSQGATDVLPPEHLLKPSAKNPEDADDCVKLVKDLLNAQRRESGLRALRENPVVDAMLADALYQSMFTFDSPTFDEIDRTMKPNDAGSFLMLSQRDVDNLARKVETLLTYPSVREVLLDERTTMLSVVMGVEEDTIAIGFLSDEDLGESHIDSAGRHVASEIGPNFDAAPPRLGRLSVDSFKKTPNKKIIDIARCYQDLVDIDEDAEGDIDVMVAIGKRGKVIGAYRGASTVYFDETESCIVDAVRDWTFDEPVGGVYMGKLSFILEQRGKKHYAKLK